MNYVVIIILFDYLYVIILDKSYFEFKYLVKPFRNTCRVRKWSIIRITDAPKKLKEL